MDIFFDELTKFEEVEVYVLQYSWSNGNPCAQSNAESERLFCAYHDGSTTSIERIAKEALRADELKGEKTDQ